MRKLFLLFFVLLIAIGLGYLIHQDPGYVMVSYNHWVIATSVWVAVAMFIIAFFVLYFLMRLLTGIFRIPKKLKRRREFLNAKKYRKYISMGLAMKASDNPKIAAKADKCFLKLKKSGLITDAELKQLVS